MSKATATPEEIKAFVQDNLTFINRVSGYIEYVDKNGNNMDAGFGNDVYEAINNAVVVERKTKIVTY